MKKIIIAFDGNHFSEGAFEFARKLNDLEPVLLTGIFLPRFELANLGTYADGVAGIFVPLIEDNDSDELVQQNISHFEKLCQGNGIDYRVHKDLVELVLPELEKESRFADLLILGSEVFYENIDTGSPNEYLKDALQHVSCPVVLVPEKFDFPESIILTYDGSEDSVFAIKQFAYLLPELCERQTLLVYANENWEEDFPEKVQIEELAARHYKDLTLFKLDINPKKYFKNWISEKRSALLVSGSYGRSPFLQLFRKSFIKDVISEHRLPVFIAHR